MFSQSKNEPVVTCRSTMPGVDDFVFKGFSRFSRHYVNCELQTKRWILRELPDDGVFVDVGANVGILSAWASAGTAFYSKVASQITDPL
jgi:hypothetical protein